MKNLLIILAAITIFSSTSAQQFTGWKNYTDMKSVKAIYSTGQDIWAATTGGSFSFNLQQNEFSTLDKTDGLIGSLLTAISGDNSGRIWFGSNSGVIDVYSPSTGSFKSILDISNTDRINKRINDIRLYGDTMFVSTGFGVTLIGTNGFIFLDTFLRFGTLTSNININSTFRKDLIYVCTDFGLAVQKPGSVNLSAPESWDIFRLSEGLPSSKTKKVTDYRDTIIVSTDRGLAYFNGTAWQIFLTSLVNIDITDIMVRDGVLYILTDFNAYRYSDGNLEVILQSQYKLNKLSYSEATGVLIASENGVIRFVDNSTTYLFPNGPAANQFPSISVAPNGMLWSASGRNNTGKGFYSFDGNSWTNYNTTNLPGLPGNDYYSSYAAADGKIYLGNWGGGFVRKTNDRFDIFTASNTSMKGIELNPQFLVITGFATDSRGNLWIMNWGAADRKNLSMLTPDSSWYHYSYTAGFPQFLGLHFGLITDQFDTKWFYSNDPKKAGLYFFNEKHTYDNTADDTSGYLTSFNGLNSNTVTALAVDRRGDIWVGTSQGVNVISNTSSVVSKTGQQLRISSVFALRQQSVNAIVVDPLNQKWIATNQGLLLVNSDGSRLLASFDSRNSALLSDIITSIAIDENSGRVYAGTEAGLTSFETLAIKPVETFDQLFIYPNPYKIGRTSAQITIDGLIRDSDIKILNITGKLIAEFSSPGGRTAVWDGRDMNGDQVNSGIYIVVAYDKEGNNVATGKLAILKE